MSLPQLNYAHSLPSGVNLERNDDSYPLPHWGDAFILIVDDADSEWPSDREGRVKWH